MENMKEIKKDTHRTIPVRMSYQAGYAQYKDWTSGTNVHCGIGYFEPFGISEYRCGFDFDEAKDFPLENFFTKYWIDNFHSENLCIYMLEDGWIYAYDGIFGAMLEGTQHLGPDIPSLRKDALVNVIVGGTGAYEGAVGLMVGHTEGSGKIEYVNDWLALPEALWKVMDGYIVLPIRE